MNNYTRKQHHIPVMILKRFIDSTGKIYMLDKEKGIKHQKPENVGFVPHLYTVHYPDKKDDSLEKTFSVIENEISTILDNLLINQKSISQLELQKLLEFTIIMMLRSPMVVNIAKEECVSNKTIAQLRQTAKEKAFLKKDAIVYQIQQTNNIPGYPGIHTSTLWRSKPGVTKWKCPKGGCSR